MNITIDDFFEHSYVITGSDEHFNEFRMRFSAANLGIPQRFDGVFPEKINHSKTGYFPVLDFTKPRSGILGCTISHLCLIKIGK